MVFLYAPYAHNAKLKDVIAQDEERKLKLEQDKAEILKQKDMEIKLLQSEQQKVMKELAEEKDRSVQLGRAADLSSKLNRPKIQVISGNLYAEGSAGLVRIEYKNLGVLKATSLDAKDSGFC